jgi:hypothetical protein
MTDIWGDAFQEAWDDYDEAQRDAEDEPTETLEAIAKEAWQGARSPLELLYATLDPERPEEAPQPTTYRLVDFTGKYIPCCVCDEIDHWVVESAPPRPVLFTCRHGNVPGLAYPMLDSKLLSKDVQRIELAKKGDAYDDEGDEGAPA